MFIVSIKISSLTLFKDVNEQYWDYKGRCLSYIIYTLACVRDFVAAFYIGFHLLFSPANTAPLLITSVYVNTTRYKMRTQCGYCIAFYLELDNLSFLVHISSNIETNRT